MKASFTLAAALVGALTLPALTSGPALAGAIPDQLHSSTSLLTPVVEGGGGGNNSGGGGGQAAGGGPAGGGHTNGGPSGHVANGQDNGGPTGHQGMANNRGDNRHSTRDQGRDRTASRDNDNRDNGHRDHRHGHFVNGVWVWYGAPYASNDCNWLRHRAVATGSPYWWSRYHDCAY